MRTNPAIYASGRSRHKLTVPRTVRGNMCGVHVSGLPSIPGGASDASLVLSWFIDRYQPQDRQTIYRGWKGAGVVDVLVSWPDSRDYGQSVAQFVQTCAELVDHGFLPSVMFASKYYDPADVDGILANALPCLKALIAADVIARACVGWELSLWLSPTQVQQLIDAFAPICNAADVKQYVHFQQGYGSFQQPGGIFADFWNANVGKLTGLWHQKVLTQSPEQYRYDSGGLYDILIRFAGGAGCSPESGFGHPFDLIALEISAQTQFNGDTTEADGNALGTWAIETPAVNGVGVMGSGNGQL